MPLSPHSDADLFDMGEGFQVLLELQLELQREGYSKDPTKLTDEQRADWFRWNAFALSDELHELMAEVGWKPWATSRHVDTQRVAEEAADLLHFFANLLLAAGVDGCMLAHAYIAKRIKNEQRQVEGYDGVSSKCADCHTELSEAPWSATRGDETICAKCYSRTVEQGLDPIQDELESGFSMYDYGDR